MTQEVTPIYYAAALSDLFCLIVHNCEMEVLLWKVEWKG